MEYTRDVLGSRFETPGGSGVFSDGVFFWRGDAAQYIEYYGIGIPAEAIEHMKSVQWCAPQFSREEYLRIDAELYDLFRPREVLVED